MKKEKNACPHCGRAMNIYTFKLTKSLATAMVRIANAVGTGSFNGKSLRDQNKISSSDYTNLTHLRYLGLIKKVVSAGQRDEGRLWIITDTGKSLLAGDPVPESVRVFNEEILGVSESLITMSEAIGYYEPPEIWARSAHPVSESKTEEQIRLF